ncbi:MAG: UDP-N-acetylglucosamine--N-acetylmuramyl-(pentapeptide) pyrophosphoryl-undecaprenol N-acetylglucosamine transferase [Candidatus Pacebacteria bacterium]|nr:UDP-N-acetylglucosamine--N-acetylmuramyl-(pentapeptide) pyrophosphoryl-undecaprenol N-acetylglucosamine transferase [Candidatus Paceibacterota bacterium]
MKIVFTGGGTAGHIFPIVAIVRELRNIYPGADLKIYYAGPKDKHGEVLLSQESVKVKNIVCGKIRRYFSFKNITDVLKVPIGIIQSIFWLFFVAPDVVFSKGGYGSFPMAFAAGFLRVPFILQESDISPGLASKITSKWALEVFTSFPDTEYFPKDKTTCLGNPIRLSLLNGSKDEAKNIFDLHEKRPLLLILGGSSGSQTINQLILEILQDLLNTFEIIHQTGIANQKQVQAEAEVVINKESKKYYHPFAFLNEKQLRHALAACNLAISRAGAGAIFEITASNKPMILIPLMGSAQDHQVKNAYKVAEYGAGEVIEEQNLKPHLFMQRLKALFTEPEILLTMSQNSKNFSRPKATTIIASYLNEYLT